MKPLTHSVWIDDTEFVVEYDHIPYEAPNYNVESPLCGPGCAEDVELISVKCAGSDHELIDFLRQGVLDLITEKILVEISE